jgi:uncharacterized protein YndB with AHSA1/START domain
MSDRIEKTVFVKAPRTRVWRAISNHEEFGSWFRVKLENPFVAGRNVVGQMIEKDIRFEAQVERVEPETLLAFRWHPYAVDPAVDYSQEPTTLVEFRLADAPGGTQLTVTESGFDQIPPHRRAEALRMNDQGWTIQVERIARYVAQ